MSISSALMKLMAWAREAEKAANVERSAKYFYDASRALNRGELAAQKAEADLARANNAATVLHKEYPEGYAYGHATRGTGKNPPLVTRARELAPEDVAQSIMLKARGGLAQVNKECSCGHK